MNKDIPQFYHQNEEFLVNNAKISDTAKIYIMHVVIASEGLGKILEPIQGIGEKSQVAISECAHFLRALEDARYRKWQLARFSCQLVTKYSFLFLYI